MLLLRTAIVVSLMGVFGACIEAQRAQSESDTDAADTSALPNTDTDTAGADTRPETDTGEPCQAQGTTRCEGVEATQICNGGTWQTVPCEAGRICVDFGGAQCLEATGDDTCRDVLYCMGACEAERDPEDRDECLVSCFISGSATAQRELGLVTSCLDVAGCNEGEVNQLECIAKSCSQPLALCYFEGSAEAGCTRMVQCAQACEDDACYLACGEQGTVSAQAEFAVLDLCIQYVCFGQDEDCTRDATSVGGPCVEYLSACLSPL